MPRTLIVLILACVVVAVTTWIAKIRLKRQMGQQLGRKVADNELTSISGWMKAHDQADKDRNS